MGKVKLSDVCDVIMGQSPPGTSYSEPGNGVPLLNGAADVRDNGLTPKKWTTAPTRTCQKGDAVLCIRATIGRTTPADGVYCLGRGVAALRPNRKIDLSYLILVVEKNLQQLDKYLSGSTIKGIRKEHLEQIEFYLPPLDEQRKISSILEKVDQIKQSTNFFHSNRGRLIQSIFIEMFGDPVSNPNNHPVFLFEELGSLDRGKSKHRPRNDPLLLGGSHPLIQTGEIRSAVLFVDSFTSTYSEFGLAQSKKWPAGTLAITIAANIAESAILGIEACFPDSIVGFTPNSKSNSIFIKIQLDFLKDRISEVAPQSAQKNINLKILREIPMICPPIEMQEQFEDFVRNATQVFDYANNRLNVSEELARSSVQSLFS